MSTAMGLDSSLSLPRESGVEHRAARGRMRKLALIWIACAALSWALTVVVGYSVMRFGEGAPDSAMVAEAEALSNVAPAAGTEATAEGASN